MKIKNLFYLIPLVFLASACDEMNINANGPIITETRSVAAFTSIDSSLPANIIITQGDDQNLTIRTYGNVIGLIQSDVVNAELRLGLKRSVRNLERLDVYITAADYERLNLSGAARLSTEGCLEIDKLSIRLSGASETNLCGIANELDVELSGASSFKAYDMPTNIVNVSVSGASDVRVSANELLDVTISGAASIRYKGNPEISSSISGAGSLINAN